ncbi:MAG: bifunctional histidinol-phosphatase/imidazoleglycerol-phosphate dehydratase, partial [Bacteroidales bacterium]|nr:bifunctional histidinol-phosphatase/imidazoleglycerol-phosphate dehydratase [Bacteroidales bacterium]
YSAQVTLHIDFDGENDHHKVEAIFKAFARSLGMAIKKDGNIIPSTKGII